MKACTQTRELLSPYLDGEVTDSEAQAVEEHLETCSTCRKTHARLRGLISFLDGLPPAEPSLDFLDRLDERIIYDMKLEETPDATDSSRRSLVSRPRDGWFFTFWVPAAAILLLAFVGQLWWQMSQNIQNTDDRQAETATPSPGTRTSETPGNETTEEHEAPGSERETTETEDPGSGTDTETDSASSDETSSKATTTDSSETGTSHETIQEEEKSDAEETEEETEAIEVASGGTSSRENPAEEETESVPTDRLLAAIKNRRLEIEPRLQAVHRLLEAGGPTDLLARICLDRRTHPDMRAGIIDALGSYPTRDHLALLIELGKTFDEAVFHQLLRQHEAKAFQTLAGLLPDLDEEAQRRVAEALQSATDPAAKGARGGIRAALQKEDLAPGIRLPLLAALGHVGTADDAELLLAHADADRPLPIRLTAVRSLGRLKADGALTGLRQLLGDEEAELREEAALALADYPARKGIVDDLLGALDDARKDGEPRLYGACVVALRQQTGRDLTTVEEWQSWKKQRPAEETETTTGRPAQACILLAEGDPRPHFARFPINARSVTFCVDVSDSMGHEGKLEAAKSELRAVLNRIDPRTRVQILRFGAGVTPCFRGPLPLTPARRDKAMAFVTAMTPQVGGTQLEKALLASLQSGAESIILLTDGQTAMDRAGYEMLRRRIRERNRLRPRARIHTIAVWRSRMALRADPEDLPIRGRPWVDLLHHLARDSGGYFFWTD